jgi:hypothetical protein
MSINFTTKNVKMPGALKAFIEKHLLDIEKSPAPSSMPKLSSTKKNYLLKWKYL